MSVLSHRLLVQLVGRCHLAAVRSAVATRAQISMASKSSKFYAVRSGSTPGIYRSWAECELQARGGGLWRARVCFDGSERVAFTQVKGFAGARHKSFTSLAAAEAFLRGESGAGGALGGAQGAGKRKRSRSPRPATHRGAHSCAAPLDADTWRLQFDGGARCVRSPLSRQLSQQLSHSLPRAAATPAPAARAPCCLALREAPLWRRCPSGWVTGPTTRLSIERSSPDCTWRAASPACAACSSRAVRPFTAPLLCGF